MSFQNQNNLLRSQSSGNQSSATYDFTEHLPERIINAINTHFESAQASRPTSTRSRGSISIRIDPETDEIVQEMLGNTSEGVQETIRRANQGAVEINNLLHDIEEFLKGPQERYVRRQKYLRNACLAVTGTMTLLMTSGILWWVLGN